MSESDPQDKPDLRRAATVSRDSGTKTPQENPEKGWRWGLGGETWSGGIHLSTSTADDDDGDDGDDDTAPDDGTATPRQRQRTTTTTADDDDVCYGHPLSTTKQLRSKNTECMVHGALYGHNRGTQQGCANPIQETCPSYDEPPRSQRTWAQKLCRRTQKK